MTEQRIREILEGFSRAQILVIGDFFLDKYLILDAALTEMSLETKREAYQVIEKRLSPGAAGTVTSNLKALGAWIVYALGMVGDDGEGYELKAGLKATGVETDLLIETDSRFTPTYTKPMLRENGIGRELNRIDIKNRQPCPDEVQQRVVEHLREVVPLVDAVVVADQVQERNIGVITDAVREELSALAQRHPDMVIIADSRTRIAEYSDLWIKPNQFEARAALRGTEAASLTMEETASIGAELLKRSHRPLFITLAEKGMLCVEPEAVHHVPTMEQTGSTDIVGAGDSVMAGIVLSLCSGAAPVEAAIVGNIVASITVQQIGVTGTATRDQVMERFREAGYQFQPSCLSIINDALPRH